MAFDKHVKDLLPAALLRAQERGIQYFMGEEEEWKLEFEGSAKFIEKKVGCPVYVFAKNGFGDYLFLKQKADANGFDDTVFEFFHEGPEVNRIVDELDRLLGLRDRPPSSDGYPRAIYETGEPVELGDQVQIKVWVEFWKGWQEGVVEYVPGISKKDLKHEYGGLKWALIKYRNGQVGPLVDPETGKLRKVRFIKRAGR